MLKPPPTGMEVTLCVIYHKTVNKATIGFPHPSQKKCKLELDRISDGYPSVFFGHILTTHPTIQVNRITFNLSDQISILLPDYCNTSCILQAAIVVLKHLVKHSYPLRFVYDFTIRVFHPHAKFSVADIGVLCKLIHCLFDLKLSEILPLVVDVFLPFADRWTLNSLLICLLSFNVSDPIVLQLLASIRTVSASPYAHHVALLFKGLDDLPHQYTPAVCSNFITPIIDHFSIKQHVGLLPDQYPPFIQQKTCSSLSSYFKEPRSLSIHPSYVPYLINILDNDIESILNVFACDIDLSAYVQLLYSRVFLTVLRDYTRFFPKLRRCPAFQPLMPSMIDLLQREHDQILVSKAAFLFKISDALHAPISSSILRFSGSTSAETLFESIDVPHTFEGFVDSNDVPIQSIIDALDTIVPVASSRFDYDVLFDSLWKKSYNGLR
ncbi:hypothetical protein GEMRC1_000653 [Eukaryota sp. GEM-RC1]